MLTEEAVRFVDILLCRIERHLDRSHECVLRGEKEAAIRWRLRAFRLLVWHALFEYRTAERVTAGLLNTEWQLNRSTIWRS